MLFTAIALVVLPSRAEEMKSFSQALKTSAPVSEVSSFGGSPIIVVCRWSPVYWDSEGQVSPVSMVLGAVQVTICGQQLNFIKFY